MLWQSSVPIRAITRPALGAFCYRAGLICSDDTARPIAQITLPRSSPNHEPCRSDKRESYFAFSPCSWGLAKLHQMLTQRSYRSHRPAPKYRIPSQHLLASLRLPGSSLSLFVPTRKYPLTDQRSIPVGTTSARPLALFGIFRLFRPSD